MDHGFISAPVLLLSIVFAALVGPMSDFFIRG